MSEIAIALAKLAGIRKAVISVLSENTSRNRSAGQILTRTNFPPQMLEPYFTQCLTQIDSLRILLPLLYGDFHTIKTAPELLMASSGPGQPAPMHFSRAQAERLVRDIDQVFEIRANSELEQPKQGRPHGVFVTHGRSQDWRAVQAFIEKDIKLPTIELAQEANLGRTIIEKLMDSAGKCNSAVIVMTGDDVANQDESRVRENVMHEIGFFQGHYGRNFVILLHEEGVNLPTNLAGVAYVPFPKGNVEAGFHVMERELKAIYKL